MKKVLFILACLVIACPAKADFTGADLQSACTNNQDICDFWITSFLLGAFGSQANAQISCPPGGTTRTQARLIIENYMRDHPEQLHSPAQDIVFAAAQLAFPCTKFAPMTPMPPET